MKTALRFLIAVIMLTGTTASAMPRLQHLAKGTVAMIDADRMVLTPERADKDVPTSFAIKEGRTRFRKDGKKAPTERPAIGQAVRLYHTKELGESVATEVSWKSDEVVRPSQK